ncbi:hypothetical protein C8Q73DRAFT_507730 [Cubamyces lactineus]|nr:hypothetical protein C8Q73DRAFT_507730 [Cubamyces lactineus]
MVASSGLHPSAQTRMLLLYCSSCLPVSAPATLRDFRHRLLPAPRSDASLRLFHRSYPGLVRTRLKPTSPEARHMPLFLPPQCLDPYRYSSMLASHTSVPLRLPRYPLNVDGVTDPHSYHDIRIPPSSPFPYQTPLPLAFTLAHHTHPLRSLPNLLASPHSHLFIGSMGFRVFCLGISVVLVSSICSLSLTRTLVHNHDDAHTYTHTRTHTHTSLPLRSPQSCCGRIEL